MYTTLVHIENRLDPRRLLELTDDDGDGTPDSAVIDAAIQVAQEVIDGYLRGRYAVPFDTAPPLVERLATDLAIADLFARRYDELPPAVEARSAAATEILQAIAEGHAQLTGVAPSTGLADSTTRLDEKRFSREALEPY